MNFSRILNNPLSFHFRRLPKSLSHNFEEKWNTTKNGTIIANPACYLSECLLSTPCCQSVNSFTRLRRNWLGENIYWGIHASLNYLSLAVETLKKQLRDRKKYFSQREFTLFPTTQFTLLYAKTLLLFIC